MATPLRYRAKNRGFTLIEVMVALAVVSMALPAMLTLVMSQLDGTVAIREKTLGFWVAENELTRIRMQQRYFDSIKLPETDKGTVTMGSMQWHWEMTREETTMEDFYRIEMLVYAGGPVNPNSSANSPSSAARRNLANKEPMARLSGFLND